MSGLVVDLFAGPGGWDQGIRQAGYTGPLVGIERDRSACLTAVKAGHWRIQADVATYPTAPFAGKTWGLIASPPCTTFSKAGLGKGLDDPIGQLVWEPLRWATELHPEWVALEQVPEVLPIWRIIAANLREQGYSVWTGLLNSADYGVPQTRVRAVLIGRLTGVAVPPQPTHAKDAGESLFDTRLPWVCMADALGWERDSGTVYRRTRGAGMVERHGERPTVPVTAPAPTITGKSRSDEWVFTRPATTVCGDPRIGRPGHKDRSGGESQFAVGSVTVTVTEAALLQSFPADYPWRGSKTAQHQQCGNAIPPRLAAAVLAQFVQADLSERAA